MSILNDLKQMLIAQGIDLTDYPDNILEAFILEAKLLINEPFIFDTQVEDFDPEFNDNIYMTEQYPIKENLQIFIDDNIINPIKITNEGLIYLDKVYHGKLTCRYIVGISNEDIEKYFLPICLNLIKEKEGKNIASINEGDISISFDNSINSNTQINNLILELKNKYNGRVVFI